MTNPTDLRALALAATPLDELAEYLRDQEEYWRGFTHSDSQPPFNRWLGALKQAQQSVPREPTKAMSEAGWAVVFGYTNGTNHLLRNGLEAAWRAMYDAAIAAQQEAP